jgi:hypothetical protein
MPGTVDTTTIGLTKIGLNGRFATFTFLCVGDSGDGSIPNTDIPSSDMQYLIGRNMQLVQVEAFPTAGGPAPDPADVFILDANNMDLLGSEDGGTTAYEGLGLISATLKRACIPNMYTPRAGLHVNYYPIMKSTITLKVSGQGTVSAKWTVVLTFAV